LKRDEEEIANKLERSATTAAGLRAFGSELGKMVKANQIDPFVMELMTTREHEIFAIVQMSV